MARVYAILLSASSVHLYVTINFNGIQTGLLFGGYMQYRLSERPSWLTLVSSSL